MGIKKMINGRMGNSENANSNRQIKKLKLLEFCK